jgi:hypothetical protein
MSEALKALVERCQKHLSELAPHVAGRKMALLLREAIEALVKAEKSERDAERYRWLREHAEVITGVGLNWYWQDEHCPHPPMQDLDSAIDAARAKAGDGGYVRAGSADL